MFMVACFRSRSGAMMPAMLAAAFAWRCFSRNVDAEKAEKAENEKPEGLNESEFHDIAFNFVRSKLWRIEESEPFGRLKLQAMDRSRRNGLSKKCFNYEYIESVFSADREKLDRNCPRIRQTNIRGAAGVCRRRERLPSRSQRVSDERGSCARCPRRWS